MAPQIYRYLCTNCGKAASLSFSPPVVELNGETNQLKHTQPTDRQIHECHQATHIYIHTYIHTQPDRQPTFNYIGNIVKL